LNVTMLGSGYVGLVSGACFAEFGVNVTCVDVDDKKIQALSAGEIPIYEPGLDELIGKNVKEGRLKFSGIYNEVIADSDLIFIVVGTPSRHGDGHADLSYVFQAVKDIAPYLKNYTVIVNKSTVPVGTARNVLSAIREANPNADFDLASNPEFLREGAAISDFMRPYRVVIGVESPRAEKMLRELYRPLNLIESPLLVTGLETAELVKYASNAFLATKISFINEIAMLCEAVGADVHDVSKGMGLDERIGRKFLHPGPGYGGSCFPKDTRALVRIAEENGVSSRIVESVIEVNEAQKKRMISKIRTALAGDEADKTVAVLGLTFKPETDDMREAASLTILPSLIEGGMHVRAHDPKGMQEAKSLLPDSVEYYDNLSEVFVGVDAVILLTEWNVYRGMDMKQVLQSMQGNTLIDLRNVYEVEEMQGLGFDYHCVGR
jgi:UDPglucose 6-dehydrogenase